jgi:hypothetical protein
VWDTVPHYPPSRLADLDSGSGFYHGTPLKNSMKEINEYYNVCKEDLDKENTVINIHRDTKLEKFRQHHFNWVANHIGLKILKKLLHLMRSAQRKVSLSPVNLGTSVEVRKSMHRRACAHGRA